MIKTLPVWNAATMKYRATTGKRQSLGRQENNVNTIGCVEITSSKKKHFRHHLQIQDVATNAVLTSQVRLMPTQRIK